MAITNINFNQSFKANTNNGQKSFMGRLADDISDAIGSTAKASESFSDIVISTKNALSSPEEATIGILSSQIEDRVVNNQKAPSWLRKIATYGSAILAAGATFIGARKAPGVIKNFAVGILKKSDAGAKVLTALVSAKASLNRLLDSFGISPVKNVLNYVSGFINTKLPPKFNIALQSFTKYTKLDKLKNLTVGDYAKNIIAVLMSYQTGKKFLCKHQDKLEDNKIQNTETTKNENLFTVEKEAVA